MSNQTVFVLGAGFSYCAGIPPMHELRDEVLADDPTNGFSALAGPDEQRGPEEILLDLRQRGDEPATKAHDAFLHATLCLLWKKHQVMPDLPEAYSRFAQLAGESVGIISLNWDLVCELTLHTADINWTYSSNGGVPIVKPHGSMNWTNHPLLPEQKGNGANGFAQVDDERSISYRPDDPFRDPLLGHTNSDFKYVTFPGLLLDNAEATNQLWAEAQILISMASKVVFIGYSLPCYDKRSRSEFLSACSEKKIAVVDPSENAIEAYRSHFGKDTIDRLGKFEDCQL